MTVDAATLSAVLATIRQRESGGDYQVQRYGAQGASGAYQYIFSTWQAWATRAGYGQYANAPAGAAPKVVQDAVAAANVQDILAGNGGRISAVPMAWYTGDPNHGPTWDLSKPAELAAYNANHGLEPGTYVASWMATYNQIAAAGGAPQATYTGKFTGGLPNPTDPGQVAGSITSGIGTIAGAIGGGVASSAASSIGPWLIAGVIVLGGVALVVGGAWRAVSPVTKPVTDKAEGAAKAGATAAVAA